MVIILVPNGPEPDRLKQTIASKIVPYYRLLVITEYIFYTKNLEKSIKMYTLAVNYNEIS